MSLVHNESELCTVDQLELFNTLPTCSQVLQTIAVPHYSISSLDSTSSTIEFAIQGSGLQYLDLSRIKLQLLFRIRAGKDKIKATNNVAPIANAIGSLFQQCDIFLNSKLVTSSNNLYAHRAYLEQLLNYSPATVNAQLSSQLFYPDTAGQFNKDATTNKGYEKRKSFVAEGALVEVIGPLFTDISNQRAYLINEIDVRVRLQRAGNSFCLMSFDVDPTKEEFNVFIEQAVLWVPKITLNPSTQLAIETTLRKRNALYNMQRTDLKSFTIGANNLTFTREHINLGLCPKYAIVGLVETDAMQGAWNSNPFRFQHFHVKHISLNVDGEQVPRGGITCNFEKNIYLQAYESLIDVVGAWKTDCPLQISREDYRAGYTLFGFRIAPDLVEGTFDLVRQTNIRLDLTFGKPLSKNVTVLVWFAYDGVLEIDAKREVFYDFSA